MTRKLKNCEWISELEQKIRVNYRQIEEGKEELGKVFWLKARDEEHGCFVTEALLEEELLDLEDGIMEIYAVE